MSEYWKSTPSYFCKFCRQYVRDTPIERRNHEASAKHQNNIQRSLRDLHKTQEREKREKEQAKDEAARLNSMFGADPTQKKGTTSATASAKPPQPAAIPSVSSAAQRKAHAEQLAALGVELPEELKKEVTGVGSYHVVSEREISNGSVTVNRSMADILAETRRQESEDGLAIKSEDESEAASKTVLKRKIEDEEGMFDEETAPKRKAWGRSIKTYPGSDQDEGDAGDLDTLLGGIKKKEIKTEAGAADENTPVKKEEEELSAPLRDVPDVDEPPEVVVKQEKDANLTPAVVFKKRKVKK